MKKSELLSKGFEIIENQKMSGKLKEELTELFTAYKNTKSGNAPKREKHITVDGVEYQWCNRHETYMPLTNFKNEKSGSCIIADKKWFAITAKIKKLSDEMLDAATSDVEKVPALAGEINELKESRTAKWNFEAIAAEYPEVEGFEYDTSKFISR